ncbi:sugar dehydrogenase [Thermomonas sp. HDW16]|nr:sugar dehydrogenase [Thermomonas sp. HDW16]
MAEGFCAGLVVAPVGGKRRLQLPRSLVQLDDDTWLIADLGGWGTARGAIWKLRVKSDAGVEIARLIAGLNVPHALAIGADGKAYVGEMSRIFRFDPRARIPADTIETMVSGLPDNRLHENRHPLSKFVFMPDGALLVNIGAPSDQCLDTSGNARENSCPESEAGEYTASLRRYAPDGGGGWSRDYTVLAKGLRNSVALAVHRSGTVLQGENSYDFTTRWFPFDEVNLIRAGRHYGWPYCAGVATPTPGWKGRRAMACGSRAHTAPVLLLPPHAAPLDMLWYEGVMFPQLQGTLLMSWHGYRSVGGRVVAFATDEMGVPVAGRDARYPIYGGQPRRYGASPSADAFILTPGWGRAAGKRPQGSPVGLAVANDGAIWVTDDRAGQVIRIAVDRP